MTTNSLFDDADGRSATVTFLGSGTSNGVPMLGVKYSEAFLAHPHNHRTRSSILISGPEGNLLVDCSPEMRLQLLRHRVMNIDAVLITHTHADHIMGMDDLRSFCIRNSAPMPVFTLPRYQEDIRRVYAYAFGDYPEGVFVPRFELHDVSERLTLAGLPVRTFTVMHGKIPVVGLRIYDFAYLTDVSEIPPEAEERLQNLETLVIDAVRLRPHPNHLNLEGALDWISRLAPRRAILTHLGHDYDASAPPPLPPNVELAFDGKQVAVYESFGV